ncbi:RelA/SpoT family protein [Bacteroidota bacterium]
MPLTIYRSGDKAFLNNFRQILKLLSPDLRKEEQNMVRDAIDILSHYQKERNSSHSRFLVRKSMETAVIAGKEINLGYRSVISILLTELVHENYIDLDSVEEKFGKVIAQIIYDFQVISRIDSQKIKDQSENFIRLLLTSVHDVRSILLKLCEQLFLLQNFSKLSRSERERIPRESYYLYASIAHRLGLYALNHDLEDLSFRYLYPKDYNAIKKKLSENLSERKTYILSFIQPLEEQLNEQNLDFHIKWRTKSIHSIWMKMKNQGVSFEQVYDIFAIRVILKSPVKEEKVRCWHCYSVVTNTYDPKSERMRDWISFPKESGYEALHITVLGPDKKWVEIQIRTERMDEQAEKGLAAHWKYKGGKPEKWYEDWLRNIREILENPAMEIREITGGKNLSLSSDEIFVFTPDGDLRKLKMGYTALDFAFDVHTNLGATCVGAKINQRIVPLKHKLNNGDRIEILTSKNQKPKLDWLHFVNSTKAKTKIRRLLTEHEYKESDIGKEILKRKFKNWKIAFNDEVINNLITHFKFKSALDLYNKVAKEEIPPLTIRKIIREFVSDSKKVSRAAGQKDLKTTKADEPDELIEFGQQSIKKLDYTLAKCCNPIKGDPITGFTTIQKGISIHRKDCPNALQMLKNISYREVGVNWAGAQKRDFEAVVKVSGQDQSGVLSNITDIFSNDKDCRLMSINFKTNEGKFVAEISLIITSINHLNTLLVKLRKIKGVQKAIRVETSSNN